MYVYGHNEITHPLIGPVPLALEMLFESQFETLLLRFAEGC